MVTKGLTLTEDFHKAFLIQQILTRGTMTIGFQKVYYICTKLVIFKRKIIFFFSLLLNFIFVLVCYDFPRLGSFDRSPHCPTICVNIKLCIEKIIFTTDPPGNTISKKTLVFTWQRRTILLSNIYFWTYQIILFPFFYKDLKKVTRIKLRPVANIENIHASQEFFRCLLGSNCCTQMRKTLGHKQDFITQGEKSVVI